MVTFSRTVTFLRDGCLCLLVIVMFGVTILGIINVNDRICKIEPTTPPNRGCEGLREYPTPEGNVICAKNNKALTGRIYPRGWPEGEV